MLSAEIAVLLLADANADRWVDIIKLAAGHAVHVATVSTLAAAQARMATNSVGLLCVDADMIDDRATVLIEFLSRYSAPMVVVGARADTVATLSARLPNVQALLWDTQIATQQSNARLNLLLTQARVHAQLQLFTAALEGTANGVVVVDARTAERPMIFANAAFSQLTGYTNDEVIGRNDQLLVGELTDRVVFAEVQAAILDGKDFNGEILCYRKDGSTFWDRLSVRPLRAADGRASYFVSTHEDVTERRRVRERLRASEARLELAMSASELAMWDWNVSTGDIYYNDQWQALLEIPTEDLLLRDSLGGRLVLPEDDASIYAELEKYMHGESSRFEREFEIRTASGKSKAVLARANVVRRDADGHALRVIGLWRDVTARKTSLRTIEETHKRWERAVAGTSDGLFDWDLVTGYVWYAPRFREQLGYDEAEFSNTFTAFQKILHDDERIAVLTKIRNHLEQRTQLDLNCRVLCKSGEYRWFRMRGNAERDAAGRPRRLSGSIRDISGQIDAETALHRSEDFYSTILDSLPLTVAYIDRNERIIYANRASGHLLGQESEVLRGNMLRDVLQPDVYSQLAAPLGIAFRNEVVECQIRIMDAANQVLDVDVTYLPHRDSPQLDGGSVQGCFLVARDVTTRLRLEAELRQSQKMEAIGRLTGGVAHDFNNLLSVTIGNAQLLSRTLKDSPRLHKQADTILRAAMRGAELTRRLLTFARQQESIIQVTKVNEVVAGMYELLRRTLPGDIDLRFELDDTVCATKLDPGQFENALLNLVINARDAMPQGGTISVRTSLLKVDANSAEAQLQIPVGEYAVVNIIDTGSGMKPEVLTRVFEPFFTTKESGKGSGLGLAMVQSFVKGCLGHVHIDSKIGVGTTVRLFFPRTHEARQLSGDIVSVNYELPRGNEKILVVEDNSDVRATAVEMLSSLGYRVFSTGTGREALGIADAEPNIALVFSDVMLPGGVSSSALLRKLRERHPQMKALLTSGFSDSMVIHRSLLDGSVEMLPKPYQLADLSKRVRDALDSEQEKLRVQA